MDITMLAYTVDGELISLPYDLTHGARYVSFTRKGGSHTYAQLVDGQDITAAYRAWKNR